VLIIQTCDPYRYFPLFAITQPTAARYAERHGHVYEAFIGISRGHLPWHSTYNRIILLHDLIARGASGWLLYLDADSYIIDLDFNCEQYLADKQSKAFVFAPARSDPKPWQVNAGIFFANLSNPMCLDICRQWHHGFLTRVSDATLANNKGSFDIYPDDQQLLQETIEQGSESLQQSIFVDVNQTFNYQGGRFARQVIRAHHSSFEDRVASAQKEIRVVLDAAKPV
jgi:hypothetical protein